ncbi:MAG: cyclic nucleotide-binding domain-containing protein [Candidatus Wallbacteria bacterium]|nr:cyclic nucleotide-binding domain-containing protein [Candidatus Wallbacteria bacterium]
MSSKSRTFFKGDVIFREGETSREAYLLLSGSLEVVKNGEVVAEIKEEGSFIGEMAVLLGEPRTATLQAKEDCELGVVTDKNFDSLVQKMPTVAYKLAKSLAFRLRETTAELIGLKQSRGIPENEPCPPPISPPSAGTDQNTSPAKVDTINDMLSQGQAKYDEKDFMEAITIWQKAAGLTGDSSMQYLIQNNISCAYLAMGELKKAMVSMAGTLKVNPRGEEILSNFALLYLKTSNQPKALELYQKVLQINPENQKARSNIEVLGGNGG